MQLVVCSFASFLRDRSIEDAARDAGHARMVKLSSRVKIICDEHHCQIVSTLQRYHPELKQTKPAELANLRPCYGPLFLSRAKRAPPKAAKKGPTFMVISPKSKGRKICLPIK